jgi:hypothetical protein
MDSILTSIYQEDQIFIKNISFKENLSLEAICLVPLESHYTSLPISYVTTENYVRCLSQSSYLLGYYIIRNKLINIKLSEEDFLKAAKGLDIYYRNLSMTFHKRVMKGSEFKMALELKNFREVHSLKDFILFTFSSPRTVISGEMSFVIVE